MHAILEVSIYFSVVAEFHFDNQMHRFPDEPELAIPKKLFHSAFAV